MAVRRESVRLDLEGDFISKMINAAGLTAGLRMELDRLGRMRTDIHIGSGQVTAALAEVSALRMELDRVNRIHARPTVTVTTNSAGGGVRAVRRDVDAASDSINNLTGRLSLLADGFLVFGPGLIPIAALGGQALSGLTMATLAAAAAGGTAIIAFQGVGDAIEAVEKYRLEPTVENFDAMREAMSELAPETRRFIRDYEAIVPVLKAVRNSAAAGLFPGLSESLDHFENLAPRLARFLNEVGAEAGSIIADSAESLDSKRWAGFLAFLRRELPDALRSVSNVVGDLGHGVAMMLKSFDPGSDSFLTWLEDVADGFDKWASSADGRDDIEAFLEYARENGAEVADLFTSLVRALTEVVQAAAPLGGPVLQVLTAVSDVVAKIAESDMATPLLAAIAAMRIYARVAGIAATAQARFNATRAMPVTGPGSNYNAPHPSAVAAAARARRQMYVQGAAGLAAIGLMATGTADDIGLTNTALLTLAGTMLGPFGAAAGAAAGLTLDLAAANNELQDAIDAAANASASDPLKELLATRQALVDQFQSVTTAGTEKGSSFFDTLAGSWGRISSYIGQDIPETEAAIASIDNLIAARRELNSLKQVSPLVGLNDVFGKLNGELTVTNSLLYDFQRAFTYAMGFLDRRSALVAYEASLDEVRHAIEENGRTLDEDTAKGRANIQVLDQIARSGIQMATHLKGARRTRFLERLEDEVGQAGKAFGMSNDQLDNFLRQLRLIDREKVAPKVDLETGELDKKQKRVLRQVRELAEQNPTPLADLFTGPFDSEVGRVRLELMQLNGTTATTYVNVVTRRSQIARGTRGMDATTGASDGTTVPKTRLHYADRHLYLLADGEEVISNRYGQADRWRPLLKAINSNRRLGDGGTAGPYGLGSQFDDYYDHDDDSSDSSGSSSGSSGDKERDRRDREEEARARRASARALRQLQRELDKTSTTLARERRERRALVDQIRGNFMSDPFALPEAGNVWSSSAAPTANPLAALTSDITDLKQYRRLIGRLDRRGLDGKALAEADTLDEAKVLAAMSRTELRQYERSFNERARLAAAAGGTYAEAAGAATVAELEKLQAEVKGLRDDIKREERQNRKNRDENTDRTVTGMGAAATRGRRDQKK